MMKKFRKEIIAIVSGMAFAYAWQLFALLMCYISDPKGDFITKDMFIPAIGIQLTITPMITWVMFGLLKVSWVKNWRLITGRGLAFLIPFVLIASITVFIAPSLWHEKMYWIGNIALSILLSVTLFCPLLNLRDSK